MHVVVTGGAGYIGSVVAARLLGAGHRVTVYDNLCRGHRQAVPAGAEFSQGDLADPSGLEQVFAGKPIDAVIHLAAFALVGESMEVPELYFRNNVPTTLALLEAMRAHGVQRIVFSSTGAVYGEPVSVPVEETHPQRPVNPYGESKLMVERMLDWFQRIHGLRYASLRYFNAAGAAGELGEDHRPESHLIPRLLQAALGEGERATIHGTDHPTPDGTCIRDYIHVSDLATAHLLALDALERQERLVFNLGNEKGFSVREVIEVARRVTGRPIPVVELARRPGDPAVLVASSAKIQRELDWRPKVPQLEAIVASAWEWHRRHPRGYAD